MWSLCRAWWDFYKHNSSKRMQCKISSCIVGVIKWYCMSTTASLNTLITNYPGGPAGSDTRPQQPHLKRLAREFGECNSECWHLSLVKYAIGGKCVFTTGLWLESQRAWLVFKPMLLLWKPHVLFLCFAYWLCVPWQNRRLASGRGVNAPFTFSAPSV